MLRGRSNDTKRAIFLLDLYRRVFEWGRSGHDHLTGAWDWLTINGHTVGRTYTSPLDVVRIRMTIIFFLSPDRVAGKPFRPRSPTSLSKPASFCCGDSPDAVAG